MIIYVGYGFDTNDIDDEIWYNLAKKYDAEEVDNHLKNSYNYETTEDEIISKEYKITDALDFIDEHTMIGLNLYDTELGAIYTCDLPNKLKKIEKGWKSKK